MFRKHKRARVRDLNVKHSHRKLLPFRVLKILVLGLIPCGLIASVWIGLPRLVTIQNITCNSQFGRCNQLTIDELHSIERMNLYDSKRGVRKTLDQNLLVREYRMRYKFPNAIAVDVLERRPVLALRKAPSLIAVVDRDGVVVNHTDSTDLPIIDVDSGIPQPGETLSRELKLAVELAVRLLPYYTVSSAKVVGNTAVFVIDNVEYIYPLQGDPEILTGTTALIAGWLNTTSKELKVSDATYTADMVKVVDLRYRNPVFRF